ncbi:MAG: SDR family NAD(P)-dependent oxidoreductase [Acidobacteriota bacterium]|nr:SDR family NAD(P)-dependent oxidoreductase [Acidobacteriota bacterium]
MPPFALVTGTSSGIGQAVARELLTRGWEVAGLARRAAPIDDPAYHHHLFDLADSGALPALVSDLCARYGIADRPRAGLVNNAAVVGELTGADRLDPRRLLATQAVNLVAPVFLAGAFVHRCPSSVPLRVVNVSTGAATRAFPGMTAYASSKAALRMAGMVMGSELDAAPTGRDVAILSFEPGVVDTAMQVTARSTPQAEFPSADLFVGFHQQGMLIPPEGPARAIADFLESNGQPHFAERRFGG